MFLRMIDRRQRYARECDGDSCAHHELEDVCAVYLFLERRRWWRNQTQHALSSVGHARRERPGPTRFLDDEALLVRRNGQHLGWRQSHAEHDWRRHSEFLGARNDFWRDCLAASR